MKKLFISVLLTVFLCLISCQKSADITGSYTVEGMDSVFTFTSDGKITVNDEVDSYSRYKIKGDTIVTYIDGLDGEISLPFEKTERGFKMGDVEYIKLPEYEDLTNNTENETAKNENS